MLAYRTDCPRGRRGGATATPWREASRPPQPEPGEGALLTLYTRSQKFRLDSEGIPESVKL
jgi:hypothetical protein